MANCRAESGKDMLIKFYKRSFRIPENLNHYSPEDYELAERKFLKYCVLGHRSKVSKKSAKEIG